MRSGTRLFRATPKVRTRKCGLVLSRRLQVPAGLLAAADALVLPMDRDEGGFASQ